MLQETLARIADCREQSAPLPLGISPFVSSTSFRLPHNNSKPLARRWDHQLSVESRRRCDSTLKASSRAKSTVNTAHISLGTGRPSSKYFPWNSLTIGAAMSPPLNPLGCEDDARSIMRCEKEAEPYPLASALNYGYAAGSPQLLRFVTEHVDLIHRPQYEDWETALTSSTTSALEIVLRMLCNPGDVILTEEYTYSGALEAARPLGLGILAVEMDDDGLLPDSLDRQLHDWDDRDGRKPSVLYTIPSGHNPTGATQTAQRRRAIYHIAEQHDLCIIEDDPYYYHLLGLPAVVSDDAANTNTAIEDYVSALPPSYLSLDISGRVIRLDTTSKILAPGLRCGWITSCSQLLSKFLNHTEFSTVAPSGPSQMMLYQLLDGHWGHYGFLSWLQYLSQEYRHRRDIVLDACCRFLPPEICRWQVPSTGMFLWIHIAVSTDCAPLAFEERVYQNAKTRGVQISKGSWFAANAATEERIHFRITFAAAPDVASLELGVERLGQVLQQEVGSQ